MNVKEDLIREIEFAESKFPEYNSMHEGYAIILEELDELWNEIKNKDRNELKVYREALQVACTAIRFCKMVQRIPDEYRGDLAEK